MLFSVWVLQLSIVGGFIVAYYLCVEFNGLMHLHSIAGEVLICLYAHTCK